MSRSYLTGSVSQFVAPRVGLHPRLYQRSFGRVVADFEKRARDHVATGQTVKRLVPSCSDAEIEQCALDAGLEPGPAWGRMPRRERMEIIATKLLREDRQARAAAAGTSAAYIGLTDELPFHSPVQTIRRVQHEIPYDPRAIEAIVDLQRDPYFFTGRVLDPPNRMGYRGHLNYTIRWKARTVFASDLVPRQ